MPRFTVPLSNGNSCELDVNDCTCEIARNLPYGHEFYFVTDKGEEIELSKLLQKRARSDGIANAAIHMSEALSGKIPKRKPIAVTAIEGGFFLVEDGNSTVTIARIASWSAVWCVRTDPC